MVTNFWQLFAEGHVWRLVRRFYPLLLGIIIGSIWSIFPTLGHSSGGFHSEALLGGMAGIVWTLWFIFQTYAKSCTA